MFLMKLKGMMAVVLLVGTLGSGAGWLYYQGATAAQPGPGRVSTTSAGGPAESKEDQLRKEVVLLERELDKMRALVVAPRAKLAEKPEALAEVRFKGKPASFGSKQLQDRSPDYRREAVTALGAIAAVDRSVIPVLVESLRGQGDWRSGGNGDRPRGKEGNSKSCRRFKVLKIELRSLVAWAVSARMPGPRFLS